MGYGRIAVGWILIVNLKNDKFFGLLSFVECNEGSSMR